MQTQGMLTADELAELAHTGEIDTVLCMFTDLQGRFMGKRILPDFFLEEVLGAEGLHACLYLLAVDMEMEPLPGYAYASWDTGYGDFRMVPDLTTLRLCPWIEKTAMVICDIADEETGAPTAVSPRQILKDQIAAAAAMGYLVKTGSELEFYLFQDSYRDAAERGYREMRPSSPYIMDYHMLQTTRDEWLIRQIRNGMRGAGIPWSSARASSARASTRSTSRIPTRSGTPTTTRCTSTVRRRSPNSTTWRSRSWRNGPWPRPGRAVTCTRACGAATGHRA